MLVAQFSSASVHSAGEEENSDIRATALQFIATFNKNDLKAMEAMCTQDAVIIDDIPPYIWQGAQSCRRFADAYQAARRTLGVIKAHWQALEGWTVEVDGHRAYVAIPVRLTLELEGGRSAYPASGGAWCRHKRRPDLDHPAGESGPTLASVRPRLGTTLACALRA